MAKSAVSLLLILLTCTAQAEIYRWIDENGAVVYSDKPRQGADAVELPGLTTFDAPASPAPTGTQADAQKQKDKTALYSVFEINKPSNDETIRDNSGSLTVDISISPELRQGHQIVYQLGDQKARSDKLQHTFTNVERGTHQISVFVTDGGSNVLTDKQTIKVHMKRYTKLLAPNRP